MNPYRVGVIMKKITINMHNWFVVRVPYIILIIAFLGFAFDSAPPFPDDDNVYQYTAFIIACLQTLSITTPKYKKFVLVTDLMTIFWLIMLAWEVYTHLYPDMAGIFALMETPTIAIFVAFGAPLRSRIYSKKIVVKTPHYGENLNPHYYNATRGRGHK